jgi:hypothetical protein
MAFRTGQPNFSKGEISEDLIARVDVAAYQVGLRRARNVTILKYGGVTKRPGTRLVAEVHDASQPVRLVPFQFSLEQTYALEMGQGYMRPAALGGLVIEEKITITSVAFGATTTIEAAYHEYVAGDQVYFDGVEGAVELNGKIARVLSVADSSHFVVDIDSTGFTAFTADTGGVVRPGPPPPPPPPPPVPPPPPPPPPPPVGGGGGQGVGGPYCVSDDTLILMANKDRTGPGIEKAAQHIRIGEYVWTRHGRTRAWGAFRVLASETRWQPVLAHEDLPRATAAHLFDHRPLQSPETADWVRMDKIGAEDGSAYVWLGTIEDANTYVSRNPCFSRAVLSHNKVNIP